MSAAILAGFLSASAPLFAEEQPGVQPLVPIPLRESHTLLPPDTRVLVEAPAIEQFLESLDGSPPDWATLYGHGHHDQEHDERLFNLNRQRDTKREGNDALQQRIAFVWSGQLSAVDPETGGFRVTLGPRFTPTGWGLVRFKYEDLPGNLSAIPRADHRMLLLHKIQQGQWIDIDVVMAGTLIPDESIVYDFSHDQEGLGLIMPVVKIETIMYLIAPIHPPL